MMNLGFFPDFKSGASVPLDCDLHGLRSLSSSLATLGEPDVAEVSVHSIASVSTTNPVELYATNTDSGRGLRWLCSASEIESIQAKLASLAGAGAGHHYFELVGTSTQLIVSVGEYGEPWWRHHG